MDDEACHDRTNEKEGWTERGLKAADFNFPTDEKPFGGPLIHGHCAWYWDRLWRNLHCRDFSRPLPRVPWSSCFYAPKTFSGYVLQYAFSHAPTKNAWRFMMVLSCILQAAFNALTIFWLPESPCFM
ncbi:hypothetical protein LINPERHAP1_LOCUS15232, partial [Linum perenne]